MALQFATPDGSLKYTFHKHEYPESLPLDIITNLNEIQYPEGQYTNQLLGSKVDDIRFSGVFYGTVMSDGIQQTAWDRSNGLEKLLNRPIYIYYAIGDHDKNSKDTFRQLVVFKEYKRKINNDFHIEYEVCLKPHKIQKEISPTLTEVIDIGAVVDKGVSRLKGAAKKLATRPTKKQTPAANETRGDHIGARPNHADDADRIQTEIKKALGIKQQKKSK